MGSADDIPAFETCQYEEMTYEEMTVNPKLKCHPIAQSRNVPFYLRKIESVFIPAIKDGAFVTDWRNGGLKFSTQRN